MRHSDNDWQIGVASGVGTFLLLLLLFAAGVIMSGCSSYHGDVLMYQGEAYTGVRTNGYVLWTRALTREQIQDGKELQQLWLAYRQTNQVPKL